MNDTTEQQNTKQCFKCKEKKLITAFPKDKKRKDGLYSYCLECKRKYNRTEKVHKQAKKWIDNNTEKHLLTIAKYRAKQKKILFSLTIEDIQIPEKCPLLGIPLLRGIHHNDTAPSIDRIDPQEGYTKNNTWIISRLANAIKWTATPEQIIQVGINLKHFLENRRTKQTGSPKI